MPMHDWSKVEPGTYHDFHVAWVNRIITALNNRLLPDPYFAMAQEHDRDFEAEPPDCTIIETASKATVTLPQTTTVIRGSMSLDAIRYANRANRIVIQQDLGHVEAVIELVSPGNKANRQQLRNYMTDSKDLLAARVHLLVIDPFPPSPRDPSGLHNFIFQEYAQSLYAPPADKPLVCASYDAEGIVAYLEPFAVGQTLPRMPLFLRSPQHIYVPLEETYNATWDSLPKRLQAHILNAPAKK
ncbi:MAG: DUF4058 family protein [Fimbriiglobus sp.]